MSEDMGETQNDVKRVTIEVSEMEVRSEHTKDQITRIEMDDANFVFKLTLTS